MLLPDFFTGSSFVVRPYQPGDEAAMFTVSATLQAAEAGDLLAWTMRLEDALEEGGAAWVAARGKRVNAFAIITPVPGLPSVYELNGGVASPWQQRGIGTRLLDGVKRESAIVGAQRLSCFVPDLTNETSRFLLEREFVIEHEECMLELDMVDGLPPLPDRPEVSLHTFPREQATALLPIVYEQSFGDTPWAQPYSAAETDALLDRPDDLLFAMKDDQPIGLAWIETTLTGQGRIEPFGIVAEHQGQGYGRWLLGAALRRLQERDVRLVKLGLWRDNTVARNLYIGAGFNEVSNWYYLAYDLPSQVVLKGG